MFLSVHSSLSKKKAKGIAKKMFIHCAFLFLYGSFHKSYKQVGLCRPSRRSERFMRLYMQKTYGDIGLWIKSGICILRVTIYASFINLYLDPE